MKSNTLHVVDKPWTPFLWDTYQRYQFQMTFPLIWIWYMWVDLLMDLIMDTIVGLDMSSQKQYESKTCHPKCNYHPPFLHKTFRWMIFLWPIQNAKRQSGNRTFCVINTGSMNCKSKPLSAGHCRNAWLTMLTIRQTIGFEGRIVYNI